DLGRTRPATPPRRVRVLHRRRQGAQPGGGHGPARGARPQSAFWLIATLPRISSAARPMLAVGVSPSSIHAHATPNTGTRQVTVEVGPAPRRAVSRQHMTTARPVRPRPNRAAEDHRTD